MSPLDAMWHIQAPPPTHIHIMVSCGHFYGHANNNVFWWHDVHLPSWGLDSSYHIRTNMSVRMGVIWGTSIHKIHKGEVLVFSSVYLKRLLRNFEIKKGAQMGPSCLVNILRIDVLVSSNPLSLLLTYANKSSMTPSSILVRVCIWVLGRARCSWSAHGPPWELISIMWLRYYALVFVCLMQSLCCMLWMKKKIFNDFLIRESEHVF